jgi:hypothetical protein
MFSAGEMGRCMTGRDLIMEKGRSLTLLHRLHRKLADTVVVFKIYF